MNPPRTARDVTEVIASILLTRKGEVIDEALAYERARNAACALLELVEEAKLWRESQRSRPELLDYEAPIRGVGVGG